MDEIKKITRIGVLYLMSAEPRWFAQEENLFPVLPMGTTYEISTSNTTKFTCRICFL